MHHVSPPREELVVGLRDTGSAVLRPLRAGEEDPLLRVFEQLSPASRANRYLAGVPALSRPMISALTAVDGRDHIAWLASIEGRPVGIGRCIRVAGTTAEVAVEVVDVHHGRGLGTALLDAVTTVACLNGIRRVEALVLAENRPSQRLVGKIGVTLRGFGSTLEGEGPLRLLDPPRVDRARVVALAARALEATGDSAPGWTTVAASGH